MSDSPRGSAVGLRVALSLAFLGNVALAAPAVIDDVAPRAVEVGGEIVVRGSGFGDRPRVRLGPLSSGPAARLRLIAANDTVIRAVVRRASSGPYALSVRARGPGESPAVHTSPIEVLGPGVASVDAGPLAAGGEVGVSLVRTTGRPRAWIGGLRARVLGIERDGAGAADLRLRVPRLGAGTWDLRVVDRHGSAVATAAVRVDSGELRRAAPSHLDVRAGRRVWRFAPRQVTSGFADGFLTLDARRGGDRRTRAVSLRLPVGPTGLNEGAVFSESAAEAELVERRRGAQSVFRAGPEQRFAVSVNVRDADVVEVSLYGLLTLVDEPAGTVGGTPADRTLPVYGHARAPVPEGLPGPPDPPDDPDDPDDPNFPPPPPGTPLAFDFGEFPFAGDPVVSQADVAAVGTLHLQSREISGIGRFISIVVPFDPRAETGPATFGGVQAPADGFPSVELHFQGEIFRPTLDAAGRSSVTLTVEAPRPDRVRGVFSGPLESDVTGERVEIVNGRFLMDVE